MRIAAAEYYWLIISLMMGLGCFTSAPALGGPYSNSAHGNTGYGANRSTIDEQFTQFPTSNCAHCHEMHASIEGAEPEPAGGPAPHALFADSFNTLRIQNPYLDTDDFCFYCHNENTGPHILNRDYSTTFGYATVPLSSGPQAILEAFNQASYHNLNDINNFLTNQDNNGQDITPELSAWFAKRGNPCSACHDSHLAKRNWDRLQTGFPLLSAISIPGTYALWGETPDEVMGAYITSYSSASYEAPYADPATDAREPDAQIGNQDGLNMPDYVTFCTSCHDPDNIIQSSNLLRELNKINWSDIGLYRNKHGALARDGTTLLREPYASSAAQGETNFILSCLDCHEPHGSANIMLLRSRINGENPEGTVSTTDAMGYVCKRCHQDDLAAAAGTGETDRWENVHHIVADAPYAPVNCTDCHASADGSTPIACGNCHGHGMDDSWTPSGLSTGRITF